MKRVPVLAALSRLDMVAVIALAYMFPNLVAPEGIAFSFRDTTSLPVTLSSMANARWIFSWRYQKIALSVVLMHCMPALLIRNNLLIQSMSLDRMAIRAVCIPFAVCLGKCTIATIANITTFLASVNWSGFGIAETVWASIV